ncbi:MAG: WecB/TagA/CpsF family glycosyltransferase [Lentisphaerae bacterium]|nr:WecB/TagA/CpsF family glycosyltransferase [Lentisphaerota bacterium]
MEYLTDIYSWGFFLLSLLITAGLTPLVIGLAGWLGAVDVGGSRRQDCGAVPLLGGLAIATPFALTCIYLYFEDYLVVDRGPRYFLAMAAACSAMALLGALDDIYHLRAKSKLVGQILIALLLCWRGNAIPHLAVPFLGVVELTGITSTIATVVWLVALTNAFRLIDGVDGLAAGLGLVSALGFAALAAVMGNTFVVFLSLTLAGSLLAFLYFNTAPARVFLGSTGSMFLGFSLAGIGLLGSHRAQATLLIGAPILILGLPIIETLISMARRFLYGHPVFFGESGPTHRRLGGRGFSPRQTVVLLCSVAVVLSFAGVMNQVTPAGTPLAMVPYLLHGAVLLVIAGLAGYALNPRKLIGSFARRGRNALLNSLSRYGSDALSLNQGHLYLNDILHMFRRHAGLRFIEVSFEATPIRIGSSGVETPSDRPAAFTERLRITQPDNRVVLVSFEFEHLPSEGEREDVLAALAQMFQKARLRRGTGQIEETSNILGIGCSLTDYQKVMETIEAWRSNPVKAKSRYIVAINPHSVMIGKRNRNVRRALAGAALSLPDGVGMVWAANMLGYSHHGRVTGPTLMLNLCDSGRAYGFRHFFYGGAEGVADEMAARLCREFPGLDVVGTHCPPFRGRTRAEDADEMALINASKADILWVGLGAPKQERWMAAHVDAIQVPIMIGVGAAFDYHSGNVKWAPKWIRTLGLEWAYRLAHEPQRLWRRNLDSPLFLFHVLLQKLKPPAFREINTSLDRSAEAGARHHPSSGSGPEARNILVFGMGRRSALFLQEVASLPTDRGETRRVVGLLAQGCGAISELTVHGYDVLGNIESLAPLLTDGSIQEVVLAEPVDTELRQRLIDLCRAQDVLLTEWCVETKPLTGPEP